MQTKLIIVLITAFLFACNSNEKTNHTHDEKTAHTDGHDMQTYKGYEFGDDKYIDIAKKGMGDLASGNVDGWLAGFADNALFRWNGGDSHE